MTRAEVEVVRDEAGEERVEFRLEDGAVVRVSLPAPKHDAPPEVRARAAIGAIAAEADRPPARTGVDEQLEETFPASDPPASSDPSTLSKRET